MGKIDYKNNLTKILNGEMEVQYCSSLRKHIIKNNIILYKCGNCGIKDWIGQELTLEIEHKDGNNWNNKKENLEFLCPNCHSQTKTYRKKKIKSQKKEITNEEILSQLKSSPNINQVLLNLGLSNSGGNYKRVHKIIKENNLEEFYHLPEVKETKIIPSISWEDKTFQRIQIIKECGIDFSSSGWGVKLSKLFGISPQATLNWVNKNIPEFKEKCFKHKN